MPLELGCKNNGHATINQIGGGGGQSIVLAVCCPTIFDHYVSARNVADFTQTPLKRGDEVGIVGEAAEKPDDRHRWLLRTRHERPRAPHRRQAPKNSRRLMSAPRLRRQHRIGSNECFDRGWNRLRYCNMRCWPMSALGQEADIRPLNRDVRFTPNSGHQADRLAMSALCQ